MLFNSPIYIFVFLPLVVVVYFELNRQRLIVAGKVWLVVASLFFYAYWDAQYLLLIICSMLANYAIGISLHRSKRPTLPHAATKLHHAPVRKAVFIVGILLNLGLLGYYKYAGFFLENFNAIMASDIPPLHIILPLAISFFTFQQIAYLADCYSADTEEQDFLNYCLFVSFFPQLIAGPIVHHREMMPQFGAIRTKVVRWRNVSIGIFIFALGLFKKVVIADSLAVWANAGFESHVPLQLIDAWGTSLSYTFQLYYDFSGYSDMAIGAALLMNIRLPVNFNSPYRATDIQDFWRRWHITLSRWLRDYLYIPLGGNRKGVTRTFINLFVTFLLGGLWHGAGWTFVIWGAMHGTAVVVHRFWSALGFRTSKLVGWFLTFIFVHFSWVFFRANSLDDALRVIIGMLGFNGVERLDNFLGRSVTLSECDLLFVGGQTGPLVLLLAARWVLISGMIAFLLPNTVQMIGLVSYSGRWQFKQTLGRAVALAFVIAASLLTFTGGLETNDFLYFNF